jgi:23S rRNA pseudouridine1911/1915/1917 synthase
LELDITKEDGAGQRLDVYLVSHLPECSRTRIQALIRDGHILLNGRSTKPKKNLKAGNNIHVTLPEPEEAGIDAQDIPIEVLYEDAHLLVLNKASGMVVHPGAGCPDETLVNALLYHCKFLSGIGGVLRPGIVHRLDKDTSGCLVVAKDDVTHRHLSEQFAERKVSKEYLAAVEGCPTELSGRIVNRIGRHPVNRLRMTVLEEPAGKVAFTEYEVLGRLEHSALVRCRLLTGRTHQIRVHMKSLHTPILGDEVYAHPERQKDQVPRLMLHSWKLGFLHPHTDRPMAFTAEIPEPFQPFLPSSW